jgi:hypothetical protein
MRERERGREDIGRMREKETYIERMSERDTWRERTRNQKTLFFR